jgi:hypothetical protein
VPDWIVGPEYALSGQPRSAPSSLQTQDKDTQERMRIASLCAAEVSFRPDADVDALGLYRMIKPWKGGEEE